MYIGENCTLYQYRSIAFALLILIFGACAPVLKVFRAPASTTLSSYAGWSNSESFQLAAGLDSTVNGVFLSTDGTALVAGASEDSDGQLHWVTRERDVLTTSWSSIDDYQYSATWDATAAAITQESNGTLWVVGNAFDSTGVSRWIVRTKASGGAWSTSDNFQYLAGTNSVATAVTVDSAGTIYVAGYGIDASNSHHWIVRKKPAAGVWSTSSDYQQAASNDAFPMGIAFDSTSSKIFVSGTATIAGSKSWVVRQLDAGTWSTIDTYQLSAGQNASSMSITTDSSGSIYVTGFSKDVGGFPHWITRSKIGVAAWSTEDDYQWTTGQSAYGKSIYSDSSGYVYSVGNAIDSSGISRWTVRKASSSVGSWSVLDELYSSSANSFAHAVCTDTTGKIYVGGTLSDSTSASWLVRTSN